jgi:hypothetical protein
VQREQRRRSASVATAMPPRQTSLAERRGEAARSHRVERRAERVERVAREAADEVQRRMQLLVGARASRPAASARRRAPRRAPPRTLGPGQSAVKRRTPVLRRDQLANSWRSFIFCEPTT